MFHAVIVHCVIGLSSKRVHELEEGAVLMNDSYRKIPVYELHSSMMTTQFFYEGHKQ